MVQPGTSRIIEMLEAQQKLLEAQLKRNEAQEKALEDLKEKMIQITRSLDQLQLTLDAELGDFRAALDNLDQSPNYSPGEETKPKQADYK